MRFISNNEPPECDPDMLETLCAIISHLRAASGHSAGSHESENLDELLAKRLSDIIAGKLVGAPRNTDEVRLKRLIQPLVNSLLGFQVTPRSKALFLEGIIGEVFENDSAIARRNFLSEAEFLKALRREIVRRAEDTLVKLRKK